MDRRDFLRDASLSGLTVAGALCPAAALLAQPAASYPGRIDVHHHYLPPFLDRMPWPWSPPANPGVDSALLNRPPS